MFDAMSDAQILEEAVQYIKVGQTLPEAIRLRLIELDMLSLFEGETDVEPV